MSEAIVFSVEGQVLVAESGPFGEGELIRIARRVFSLDLDLSAFAASLEGEPDLARALARGGGRMLRAPSVFEDAVKVLLTTNCTWAATRLMVARLIGLHGTGAFPEPEDVARFSRRRLRDKVRCGYRAEALARFARRVASGKLDLSRWGAPAHPGPARLSRHRLVDQAAVPAPPPRPERIDRRFDRPAVRALQIFQRARSLARHDAPLA
jgi:hypothetical protein